MAVVLTSVTPPAGPMAPVVLVFNCNDHFGGDFGANLADTFFTSRSPPETGAPGVLGVASLSEFGVPQAGYVIGYAVSSDGAPGGAQSVATVTITRGAGWPVGTIRIDILLTALGSAYNSLPSLGGNPAVSPPVQFVVAAAPQDPTVVEVSVMFTRFRGGR